MITKAEQLARQWKLHRFEVVISDDHNRLLEIIDQWKALSLNQLSLAERIALTHVDRLLAAMMNRRLLIEHVELIKEDPLFLLLSFEAGVLLHHVPFKIDIHGNPHLLSRFLSVVLSFSREIFSQGLERIKIERYDVILRSLELIIIAYMYEGPSYQAQQKLKRLAAEIERQPFLIQQFEQKMTYGIENESR